MLFRNHKIDTNIQIEIEDVMIERVYEHTFLAVMLDHQLCWKPHINYLCSKMAILAKTKLIHIYKALHT